METIEAGLQKLKKKNFEDMIAAHREMGMIY
jgi:hypothetical protein